MHGRTPHPPPSLLVAVGCMQSKKADELVAGPSGMTASSSTRSAAGRASDTESSTDSLGRLLPGSNIAADLRAGPTTPPRNSRLSVKYQSKEMSGSSLLRASSGRSSSRPSHHGHRIGTHTRHGLMPGQRGFTTAKINQDRGVVCWPFNGSFNQALLCVFDGHGSKGEKASEFCMHHIPAFLENDEGRLSLRRDPIEALRRACVKTDESLFASELGKTAMTCGTTSTVLYLNGADCWTACAGDSRAVLGRRVGGQIIAQVRRAQMASVI